MTRVHVEEQALVRLKNVFGSAGEKYKSNYSRLSTLIREITSGHIKGNPADELLKKYEEKKDAFDQVYKMINSTQEYLSGRTGQFISDMDELMDDMQ